MRDEKSFISGIIYKTYKIRGFFMQMQPRLDATRNDFWLSE